MFMIITWKQNILNNEIGPVTTTLNSQTYLKFISNNLGAGETDNTNNSYSQQTIPNSNCKFMQVSLRSVCKPKGQATLLCVMACSWFYYSHLSTSWPTVKLDGYWWPESHPSTRWRVATNYACNHMGKAIRTFYNREWTSLILPNSFT